ncbi:MAG TPA: dihydroneopterin aldolase [Verrucomicrobiales bacterium]|jgi:FolB domain-containing protein|nr:dihydroneopterin aldolase [Verrucomicrobiales bacterium]HCL97428.1 dihydroneopterin aldolase [Verrucomicrobiales bacterium]
MKDTDEIIIKGLRLTCHVGVPDEERAQPQELLLHVRLHPFSDPQPLQDDITRTIDYHAVALHIEQLASERPRKLIETLAEDIAASVVENFSVSRVAIEIEKFILPNTRSVGVRITRLA